MAEASAAVGFQFSVGDDGIHYQFSAKVLYAILRLFFRGYSKRIARISNAIRQGTFPSSPLHFFTIETSLMLYLIAFSGKAWLLDLVFYYIDFVFKFLPWYSKFNNLFQIFLTTLPIAIPLWFLVAITLQTCLKLLLMHTHWIFDNPKKPSLKTKLWVLSIRLLKVLCGPAKELIYSYQRSLPKLPLPPLSSTIEKYLDSVRPYLSKEKSKEMESLAQNFLDNEGTQLQRYLKLRSWITQNYIADWWEDYVYLASGRKPTHPNENSSPYPGIMINSNYYCVGEVIMKGPRKQASRAASMVHLCMEWKSKLESEQIGPLKTPNNVPLCMNQYKRVFGTSRIPMKGQDYLVTSTGRKSRHVAVYQDGMYYKIDLYSKGRMVKLKQLEKAFEEILSAENVASDADRFLPAFTALDRDEWAEFREKYTATGLNKRTMDVIDTAAFIVVLDNESQGYGKLPKELYREKTIQYKQECDKDRSDFSELSKSLLTGSGYNRWFDKCFNLVVFKNGEIGLNCEHSYADAPVLGHLIEVSLMVETDYCLDPRNNKFLAQAKNLLKYSATEPRYTRDGYLSGDSNVACCKYERLRWDFNNEATDSIYSQKEIACKSADSVDLKCDYFPHFGKETIKQCKCSPDAFLQMALQLAIYKNMGEFCLTYESAMTRFFREGRTETVRPVTEESCRFVRLMMQDEIDVVEAYDVLQVAMKKHVNNARKAMIGEGIDRHLFALFVVSKGKNISSPFLEKVILEPWKLSTSQTPACQTGIGQEFTPECSTGGGGFGPVTRHGYGVSYIFSAGRIAIHVSSFKDSPKTDSAKFYNQLVESMMQIRNVCFNALEMEVETEDKSSVLNSNNGHIAKPRHAPKLNKMKYMSFNDSFLEPRGIPEKYCK